MTRYATLLAALAAEFPGFRLVRKDTSRLQRAIHCALAIVTLGGQRRYLTDYHTTLGRTVYVTPDWDDLPEDERYVTLRHERAHLRQFRRLGFPLMALLYGLASGRTRILPGPTGDWDADGERSRGVAGAFRRERIRSAARPGADRSTNRRRTCTRRRAATDIASRRHS